MTSAISPGSAARARRVVAPSASMRSGAAAPVKTGPGAIALTRTPTLANSIADAARSFCSNDDLIQGPLGFLWYGDTSDFTQHHDYGLGIKPQVVGGRVFTMQSTHSLFAYDAYTGRFLWKNPVQSFRGHTRFAALAISRPRLVRVGQEVFNVNGAP